MIAGLRRTAAGETTQSLVVTSLLVAVVLSMVMPMPASLLDVGIALSIAFSTMVLVMASLVGRPTEFQAFPVLLLVTLIIRLSLNVSSTRLILSQGHTGPEAAGQVISGFSRFVAGGSLMTGMTIFAVISAVNFMVITKGAGRMAEVSARFALDSLPGKQLAIDGDLNSGAIDHEEAKRRRQAEQQDISFFGSLDGASKFVKGDAVAGIVITLINLVVGVSVGVASHGLPVATALDSYARLTIGDGLVSQIPSVITSMAAALLLSRGGSDQGTSQMLVAQTLSRWTALAVVAATMIVLALVPGMPTALFLTLGTGIAAAAAIRYRAATRAPAPDPDLAEAAASPRPRIGDDLDLDDLSVEIGSALVPEALDAGRGLATRIANLRTHIARQYGLVIPEIRITDDTDCGESEYVIRVQGVVRGRGALRPRRLLIVGDEAALDGLAGEAVKEPVFGSAARWIDPADQDEAALAGATVVTPTEVLSTHLLEIIRANLPDLLTLSALQRMTTELKELSDPGRASMYQRYFETMLPEKVTPEQLITVLRQMLAEDLSIRNLPLIIDAVHESRSAGSAELIFESVRRRLRGQITERLSASDGTLNLVQLHPAWEAELGRTDGAAGQAVPSAEAVQKLVARTRTLLAPIDPALKPVIAAPDHRRRYLRDLLVGHGVSAPVIGFAEIDPQARVRLVGTIEAA